MSSLADLNWQSVADTLGDHGIEVIIVGGQAVNFWGQSFPIKQGRPFTSVDVDVIIDQGLDDPEAILDGELIKSTNPLGALLATFKFDDEYKMDILLPDKIMGLSKAETDYLKKKAKSFHALKFRVADPISLLNGS